MTQQLSRRSFLKHAGAMSGVSLVSAPLMLNLSAIADAAAATTSALTDYKALVCLFLAGGNDSFSTVMPMDTMSVDTQTLVRPFLTQTSTARQVTPIEVNGQANSQIYGLHPNLTGVEDLFNQGKAAVVSCVGPLVRNITKQEYFAGVDVPQALYSHNDQVSTWQSGKTEGATMGWGGSMEAALAPKSASGDILDTFRSVSLNGSNVFGATDTLAPYSMSPWGSGAIEIADGLFKDIASKAAPSSNNLLEQDYANMVARALLATDHLQQKMKDFPGDTFVEIPNDSSNDLSRSLRQIARMIYYRKQSGLPGRQVFYVVIGGFDTHDSQVAGHGRLMKSVNRGISYFQAMMDSMTMGNQVTLFTAADFGRQLQQNKKNADAVQTAGTDHGWGAHHFVVGGAVQGKRIYGRVPVYSRGADANEPFTDPNIITQNGIILPQFSVEQYAATLGGWFGLDEAALVNIMPALSRYSVKNLGFLKACDAPASAAACNVRG
jgi:uncharacterized protein (DUF1501 family)